MKKYKFTFVSSRKLRVDDSKKDQRIIEAENMEIAITKFFVFIKSFYGSAPLLEMNVVEA